MIKKLIKAKRKKVTRVAVHVEISPDIGKNDFFFFFCGNVEIWGNSVEFVVCRENFWGN
jgi:hypothetical protein